MIDKNKFKRIEESANLYHIYVEGDYLYMIRQDDFTNDIEKTARLRAKGVNFAGPISQIKLGERTVAVEEHLAKGTSFEKVEDEYRFSSSWNPKEVLEDYTIFFNEYLEELRLRAEADQVLYDKLFSDIIEMNKESLTLDTCSLGNLFFDKTVGFSIIDAHRVNTLPNIGRLFWMIIGNASSIACIENEQSIDKCVPQESYEKFMIYIGMITDKFKKALAKANLQCDEAKLQLSPNIVTEDTIKAITNMEKSTIIRAGV